VLIKLEGQKKEFTCKCNYNTTIEQLQKFCKTKLLIKPEESLFLLQGNTIISQNAKISNIKKNEFGKIELKVQLN